MQPHYTRFLEALAGIPGDPVLFEPFIPPYLTEQLIWRRGLHLWETIPAYLDTLLSLRERTYADVVVTDMRHFGDALADEMAETMETLADDTIRFVALCNSPHQWAAASHSSGVCAVGLYRWQDWLLETPNDAIAMDGDCDAAIERGFAGVYCPTDAEKMWETHHGRIAIVGGLGVSWLQHSQPVAIHQRCEELFRQTGNAGYLVGTGGRFELGTKNPTPEDYLSLISLLGIYRKYR